MCRWWRRSSACLAEEEDGGRGGVWRRWPKEEDMLNGVWLSEPKKTVCVSGKKDVHVQAEVRRAMIGRVLCWKAVAAVAATTLMGAATTPTMASQD